MPRKRSLEGFDQHAFGALPEFRGWASLPWEVWLLASTPALDPAAPGVPEPSLGERAHSLHSPGSAARGNLLNSFQGE
jgi:hypothetical protein